MAAIQPCAIQRRRSGFFPLTTISKRIEARRTCRRSRTFFKKACVTVARLRSELPGAFIPLARVGAGGWPTRRMSLNAWRCGLQSAICNPNPATHRLLLQRRDSLDKPRPHRPRLASAHLRHHLAPGRRQDHADRKAAAVRRRDSARGRGEGEAQRRSDALRLDEHRARARHFRRHLGDDVRIRRLRLQPARHAGPRGLFRRHLPHAVRRRLGGHGHRRRQGHRGAHAQAVRSLPPARHSHRHLHQQARPRRPRPLRAARRDREDAGARHGAGHLADRRAARLSPAPTDFATRSRSASSTRTTS